MITTEQILSIDGGWIRTTGGIRRAAGNALHKVGDSVTVCGDLVLGWRRKAAPPLPAPWPEDKTGRDFLFFAFGYFAPFTTEDYGCGVLQYHLEGDEFTFVEFTPVATGPDGYSPARFLYSADLSRKVMIWQKSDTGSSLPDLLQEWPSGEFEELSGSGLSYDGYFTSDNVLKLASLEMGTLSTEQLPSGPVVTGALKAIFRYYTETVLDSTTDLTAQMQSVYDGLKREGITVPFGPPDYQASYWYTTMGVDFVQMWAASIGMGVTTNHYPLGGSVAGYPITNTKTWIAPTSNTTYFTRVLEAGVTADTWGLPLSGGNWPVNDSYSGIYELHKEEIVIGGDSYGFGPVEYRPQCCTESGSAITVPSIDYCPNALGADDDFLYAISQTTNSYPGPYKFYRFSLETGDGEEFEIGTEDTYIYFANLRV